jgi:hypothetical protein
MEVLRQRALRGPLLTLLISGAFCAPLVTFSPVLVKEAFDGNIAHFSTLLASFGAGGLLDAIVLLGIAPTVDRHRLQDPPRLPMSITNNTWYRTNPTTVSTSTVSPISTARPVRSLGHSPACRRTTASSGRAISASSSGRPSSLRARSRPGRVESPSRF